MPIWKHRHDFEEEEVYHLHDNKRHVLTSREVGLENMTSCEH